MNNVTALYVKTMHDEIKTKIIRLEEVPRCMCGSEDFELLENVDRFGLPFKSYVCRQCSIVFRSPRLSEESLPYYYQKFYHPIHFGKTDFSTQEALYNVGQGLKIFKLSYPFLTHKNSLNVLEIGAGTGSVLQEFASEAQNFNIKVQATGTEYSDECIMQGRSKGVMMIRGGFDSPLLQAQGYDFIILSHVFEHFSNLHLSLERIKALLKPQGLIYIEVPGIYTIHHKSFYRFSFISYITHAHMYDFTSKTLSNIVEKNGLIELYSNEAVEALYKVDATFSQATNVKYELEKEYPNILRDLSFLKGNQADVSIFDTQTQVASPHDRTKNYSSVPSLRDKNDILFVYIDPGYKSNLGHYHNFAVKIHKYVQTQSMDIWHYVNHSVLTEDRQRFNLKPLFTSTGHINEATMSANEIAQTLNEFDEKIRIIFEQIKEVEPYYEKIILYMYTCHCLHIQVVGNVFTLRRIANLELHLVLLTLNESIVFGKKNKAIQDILEAIDTIRRSNDAFHWYMDSSKALLAYQKFFTQKISTLPIPIHSQTEANLPCSRDETNVLTLAFFGYANQKYGFHLIYQLYRYFGRYFRYIIRLNSKMCDAQFQQAILRLKQDPHVLLIDEYIEEALYVRLIQQSDMIVIPYLQESYPMQTSGIFMDALWYHKFVIATNGTWMGDSILENGGGLVFESNSVESLIQAILLGRHSCLSYNRNSKRDDQKAWFTVEKMFEIFKGKAMKSDHEAFNEKNLDAITHKQACYQNFLTLQRQMIHTPQKCEHFRHVLYPAVKDSSTLEALLQKLTFALPDHAHISLIVPLDQHFDRNSLNTMMENYRSFRYIEEEDLSSYIPNSVILIYDMSSFSGMEVFQAALRVEIIDKEFFSDIEAETLRKLYYKTLQPADKHRFGEKSIGNFTAFKKKNIHKKQAFCFTSGPSFDRYKTFTFPEDSLKIICNSIVKNDEFLKHIGGADLIAFGDPVFHFGPSSYAELFRQDVLNLVLSSEVYLIIPEMNVPLMLAHYPQLQDRIIGIGSKGDDWNFPRTHRFFVKNTSNILTLLMLPFASTLADTIFILGADGRQEHETYFWNHSASAQYGERMEDAFKMHPSFFRDRIYTDYYQEHCALLESLLLYGESFGKVYFSLAPSFIPALKHRQIDFHMPRRELISVIEEKRDRNLDEQSDGTKQSARTINYDFAKKMNILYGYIAQLRESRAQIALYGHGLVGKLIAREIPDQIAVIVDQNSNDSSGIAPLCKPSEVGNFEFDFMVITVLGREKEIVESVNIEKSKVVTLDLREDERHTIFLARLDKNDPFLQQNLRGSFTRESHLTLDETELISLYLSQSNGIMIDVGAHWGSSAKGFLDKGWLVYAYEPDPANREKLEQRLAHYDNIVISDKALSDTIGQSVDFYASPESTGISSLLPFSNDHQKVCRVSTVTLAQEIERLALSSIDFLKIDTEGYDLMVLKGFPWHRQKPCVILCEYEDSKTLKAGYVVQDTIDYLVEKGYYIYVSEWHSIVRYGIRHDWKRFFKYDRTHRLDSKNWGNIIAFSSVPDENKLVTVLDRLLHLE